jgi:hypothetical protein
MSLSSDVDSRISSFNRFFTIANHVVCAPPMRCIEDKFASSWVSAGVAVEQAGRVGNRHAVLQDFDARTFEPRIIGRDAPEPNSDADTLGSGPPIAQTAKPPPPKSQ